VRFLLFSLALLAFPQSKPSDLKSALAAVNTEDSAQNRNRLGKAYEANGQTDKAVLELQEAIRKNEYEESYYFDLAHVLLRHQNFDVAIQVLESSRRIFAKSAQLELALGVAYYGQRRFSEAVDSFLRTIAIAPGIAQPYVFLGRILEHADKRLPEIAERFQAQASALPKDFMAQYLLGKVLAAQSEQWDKAEAALRSSIALKPDFWESHYELGLLLEKVRKFEEAGAELERSAALNPQVPTPHYRLARVYDRLGKTQDAVRERALHEKLTAEEKAAMEKHAASIKRLVIK
jgi:tetratricopeptide (TPR) repeat protein